MELSKNQTKVIELLRLGWELGLSISGLSSKRHVWLQKDGLGKGGEIYKSDMRTLNSLVRKNIIVCVNPNAFGTQVYKLIK